MLPWLIFALIVIGLLLLDLGLFQKTSKEISFRQALLWSCGWIVISLLFNVGVWVFMGPQAGLNFLTGYLLEKSLSMDNLFVFVAVFSTFQIPKKSTHKILFWGIFGALIMRALFIGLGLTLVEYFEWIFYVFGIILILSGIQLGFGKKKQGDFSQGWVIRTFEKWMPVTTETSSNKFFLKTPQGLLATPLFLALLTIETADVIFALDSIPAIFAITKDPFIVYTSNIFAILGMRSLYFLLEHAWNLFEYLHIGIAAILVLIGVKMIVGEFYPISNGYILLFVFAIMGICIVASLLHKKQKI